MMKVFVNLAAAIFLFVLASLAFPAPVSAHCDTLDGPVIAAARKAMATGNANFMLIWVKPEHEDEIRKALRRAKAKKKAAKTKDEKEKAEMELFETLVKIHRQGEGAPYEGIKPAGSVDPELAAADRALESGSVTGILGQIPSEHSREIITHLFHRLKEKSGYNADDLPAGREYIEAYVLFIHAVEKALKGEELSEGSLHEH